MADIEKLVVQIEANNDQLRADLRNATKALETSTNLMSKSLDEVAKNTQKSAGFMRGALQSFTGFLLADVAQAAFGALKNSAAAAFNAILVGGVKSAQEAQAAYNGLRGAFERTGRSAEDAASFFEEFADAIEKSSLVTQEQVARSGQLLAQMTALDNQGLKQATQSAVDLSAALGIELEAATQLVGKAINGNTEAFRRYGITLQESSDKGENAALVLDQLSKRFGGAATNQVATFSGSLKLLQDGFDDIGEVFGNAIIDNKAITGALSATVGVFRQFIDFLKSNESSIATFFAEAVSYALKFGGVLLAVVDAGISAWRSLLDVVDALGKTIAGVAAAAVKAFSGDFKGALDVLSVAAQDIGQDFKENFEPSIITGFSDKLAEVSGAADMGLASMKAGGDEVAASFNGAAGAARNIATELTEAQNTALEFARALAEEGRLVNSGSDQEALKAQLDAQLITEEEYYAQKQELLAAQIEFENQQLATARETNLLSEQEFRAAELQLAQQQSTELLKLDTDRAKAKQKLREAELSATAQLLGGISELASVSGKELGGIAKAAAIAQATINTYVGATKAIAQGGVVGPVLAAAVIASGLAQVAKIAATPLNSGIDSVPGVGNVDNFPALLTPGERVVPKDTNRDLKDFLADGQERGPTMSINVTINDVFTTDPRELGARLIDVINEAQQANGVRLLSARVQ